MFRQHNVFRNRDQTYYFITADTALWVLIIFPHSFFVSLRIFFPAVQQLFTGLPKIAPGRLYGRYRVLGICIKTGPLNLVENHCPIGFSCKFLLVFKRIFFDFIYPKVKFLICKRQLGFMKLTSTVTQVVEYLGILYKSQDNSSPALSVYFDIKRAFDTNSHYSLLSKFQVLGSSLGFALLFESYLSDRLQCVKVNNTYSRFWNLTSGASQGSVLGPLLFLLFINDMLNLI